MSPSNGPTGQDAAGPPAHRGVGGIGGLSEANFSAPPLGRPTDELSTDSAALFPLTLASYPFFAIPGNAIGSTKTVTSLTVSPSTAR
jgi:hypothetical protein